MTAKGHEGTFRKAGDALRLDLGDGYAGVCICQNADLCVLLYEKYTSIENNFSLQEKKTYLVEKRFVHLKL